MSDGVEDGGASKDGHDRFLAGVAVGIWLTILAAVTGGCLAAALVRLLGW